MEDHMMSEQEQAKLISDTEKRLEKYIASGVITKEDQDAYLDAIKKYGPRANETYQIWYKRIGQKVYVHMIKDGKV
jgi:hypothetical protein